MAKIKHEIKNSSRIGSGFLFPIIGSDFSFSNLLIRKGIYLIDISNSVNWSGISIKSKKNVGILITQDIKNIHIGGTADIETAVEILLLFCFLKTKRSYSVNECYEVTISSDKKMKLITKKPIDAFLKYGWVFIPFYNFLFGSNRGGILTKNLFNRIKRDRKYFEKYKCLIQAQLFPAMKSPLGVAMNTFFAAFANDGQDDPKFILVITALEALFSISPHEVNFRLSNAIAWFLHPKPSNYRLRKKMVEKVKRLYNLRSRLVHGAFQEISTDAYDEVLALFSTIAERIVEEYNVYKIFLSKNKHLKFISDLETGYFRY